MTKLSEIYELSSEEYLLLSDIVEIGEGLHMEKVSQDMKNKQGAK